MCLKWEVMTDSRNTMQATTIGNSPCNIKHTCNTEKKRKTTYLIWSSNRDQLHQSAGYDRGCIKVCDKRIRYIYVEFRDSLSVLAAIMIPDKTPRDVWSREALVNISIMKLLNGHYLVTQTLRPLCGCYRRFNIVGRAPLSLLPHMNQFVYSKFGFICSSTTTLGSGWRSQLSHYDEIYVLLQLVYRRLV